MSVCCGFFLLGSLLVFWYYCVLIDKVNFDLLFWLEKYIEVFVYVMRVGILLFNKDLFDRCIFIFRILVDEERKRV